MRRIRRHGKGSVYVLLRKRDRKYLIIRWWTHSYRKPGK